MVLAMTIGSATQLLSSEVDIKVGIKVDNR